MRNIGSYIIIIVLIINVVNIGIFYKKEFKNLKEEIFKILNNTCKKKTKHFKSLKRKSKSNINLISLNINKNMEINKSSTNNDSITNKKKEINNKIKNTNTSKNNNSLRIFKRKTGKNKSKKIELNGLTDNEINSFNFEKALKYDNRTYYEYYISLLKTKHLLIFTRNDYNSPIIKICLFFFSFSLLFVVNSLFFQEKKIQKIYKNNGYFDFIYEIPQVCYSAIISSIINYLLKYFALSEKKIIDLKRTKNIQIVTEIRKALIIKFILFYI